MKNRPIMKMVRDNIVKVMNKLVKLFNKPLFLYKYYIKIPLTREIYLLNTTRKVKKIIKKILKYKNIPGLSEEFTAKHNINIHILCSHASLESCFLSLASFYFFSREYPEIVIHEDGTFTKKDEQLIKEIFPWVKYLSLKDADAGLKNKNFSPETIALRHKHKLLIKAVDFHHIESKERILIIDTDIFILGNMTELWDGIIEGRKFVFNNDPEPAYGSAKELLEKVLGRKLDINVKPCVNTGFIVEPASMFREEKTVIERYAERFENFPFRRIHCIEQGYVACIAKDRKIDEYFLSYRYKVVGYRDRPAVEWLKRYDFVKNPDSTETVHLCGWDKLERDFQVVKKKLFTMLTKNRTKIVFYPNTVFNWLNPFWRILRKSLARCNIEVTEMRFSFFNLLRNRKKVSAIHFHYVYSDVSRENYTYLPKRVWNRVCPFIVACSNKTFGAKLKIAKLLGYRIIYTVHNLNFHEKPNKDMERNLNRLYNFADSIIVMGKDTKEKVTKSLGKKDIRLIPPFHFEGAYKNTITKVSAREKLGIPGGAFVYLFFGNIQKYKGADILIKTFKKTNLNANLLITGDISMDPLYAEELNNLIGNDKRITMIARKGSEDIGVFLNAADIVVFPFRQTTNSGAVMLAKSFYKPTICMDTGNIRDYANPVTDILVRNEKELKKALLVARKRSFPENREEYLKGIPAPEEVARMHKTVYGVNRI